MACMMFKSDTHRNQPTRSRLLIPSSTVYSRKQQLSSYSIYSTAVLASTTTIVVHSMHDILRRTQKRVRCSVHISVLELRLTTSSYI